jgi:hypothetical protein
MQGLRPVNHSSRNGWRGGRRDHTALLWLDVEGDCGNYYERSLIQDVAGECDAADAQRDGEINYFAMRSSGSR